ncbi:hypothetical protein BT96DRAFT_258911 [Gymnopus androsaceus JB14]|uniref:Uncharacterized protein n=1 Tax=Gymnopus androsaceus JB14 TaxID=1447944 RepID=A0A6A4H433_9AGAR|nr:hypothetical protein BT96DRAFT_258911 [Gymnopus androsaceus JB14]
MRDKWSAFIFAEDLLSGIPTQPTPTSKRAREDNLDSHDEQNSEPNTMTFSVAEHRSPATGFHPIDLGQAVHLGWNSPGANSSIDTQAKFAQPEVNAFIPQSDAIYQAFEAQPLYENDSIIDLINGQNEAAIQAEFLVGSDAIQDGSTLTQYD